MPLSICPRVSRWNARFRRMLLLTGTFVILLAQLARQGTADTGDGPTADEKRLLQAGLGTSGAELLDFFRARTLTEERRRQVPDVITLLGDNEIKVRIQAARELIAVGRPAVTALQAAAQDKNSAVAQRARQCLMLIEAEADLPAAALRLLVAARPASASTVLLDYLPSAADERLEEEICAALAMLGVRDGQPERALVAATQSQVAVQRMAAAEALVRSTGAAHRAAARQFLDDPEPRVRWHTARMLLRVHDKSAIPGLVTLVGNGPPALARQADGLLRQIAGDQAPAAGLGSGDAASRQQCRDGWLAWWQAHGVHLDLTKVNLQGDADLDGAQLTEQAVQIIRAALKQQPREPRELAKARIAAGMIAVYAQSGPGGAATPLRATRRDAALRLTQAIQAERYDEASKQVDAFLSLSPDRQAALGTVPLGKHLAVLDVMAQFRPERTGGLGIEMKFLKLEDAAKKEKTLPAAALNRELALQAAHLALVVDVLKEHAPRKSTQEWLKHCQEMRQAAVALGQAAKAKDGQAAWAAVRRLNESCASCHEAFR